MRVIILSDIHSNQIALESVLEVLPVYDQLWCLGDTIGYGPHPNECLGYMRDLATHALTGNHDLASIGEISLADFNPLAKEANAWNGAQLSTELRRYLKARPAMVTIEPNVTLAHASPRDPIWEYILDIETAEENLPHFTSPICFVGHTHVPMLFAQHADRQSEFRIAKHEELITLQAGSRYIINPGSVGQPRDGDPRAAYLIWDTEARTIQFERIGYDIAATQKQMQAAGLPPALAARLALGE